MLKYKLRIAHLTVIAAMLFMGFMVPNVVLGADDETATPGEINFKCGNAVSTAKGTFHEWKITESLLNRDEISKSMVTIEVVMESLDTNIKMRDKDLKKEEFFDVENHPKATIHISKFTKKSDDNYTASMDITIKGIKKTMPINFTVSKDESFTVSGTCVLNRTDFKVGGKYHRWNPMSVKEIATVSFSAVIPE